LNYPSLIILLQTHTAMRQCSLTKNNQEESRFISKSIRSCNLFSSRRRSTWYIYSPSNPYGRGTCF